MVVGEQGGMDRVTRSGSSYQEKTTAAALRLTSAKVTSCPRAQCDYERLMLCCLRLPPVALGYISGTLEKDNSQF